MNAKLMSRNMKRALIWRKIDRQVRTIISLCEVRSGRTIVGISSAPTYGQLMAGNRSLYHGE
jgi:hypothetical protein